MPAPLFDFVWALDGEQELCLSLLKVYRDARLHEDNWKQTVLGIALCFYHRDDVENSPGRQSFLLGKMSRQPEYDTRGKGRNQGPDC